MQTKTFTQSVNELADELCGMRWTFGQLVLQSKDYLVRTGTKRPSQSMQESLARAVSDRIDELRSGEV